MKLTCLLQVFWDEKVRHLAESLVPLTINEEPGAHTSKLRRDAENNTEKIYIIMETA